MRKLTTEEYIKQAKVTHGDRYDYSSLYYVNNGVKVDIICKTHGVFKQRCSDHIRGFGCPKCSGKARGTTERFIEKARSVHHNLYDYSQVDYVSLDEEITIICPKHGEWKIKPRHHIYGSANGCAKCQTSKGENEIQTWLESNKIEFKTQKTFKGIGAKRFDFYLPKFNAVIEFDGAQHFHLKHQRTRNKENALKRFNDILRRDKEKDEFCKLNQIPLLRINYLDFIYINTILEKWTSTLLAPSVQQS